MSVAEKLQAMEELWTELQADQSEVESPKWHEEELASRKQRIESGEARFISLDALRNYKK